MPRPISSAQTPATYTINIDGKTIDIKDERVAVSTLKYDLKNPRLHSELGLAVLNGSVISEQIEEKIWAQADTRNLFKQILADGGLIEPPFIRHDNIVAEGNRRLVCVRKILFDANVTQANNITPETRQKFTTIFVHRIGKAATDHDILKLLLDWHVSSKKPWAKPDQTEVLWRLFEAGTTIEELARRTRETMPKMQNRIDAYKLLMKHRDRCPGETPTEQSNLLSHYREALDKGLQDWMTEQDNQAMFDGWVKTKKISNVKDTRDRLPEIIAAEGGLELLTEESMNVKDAFNALGTAKKGSVFDRMDEWAEQIENVTVKTVTEFKTNKGWARRLRRLKAALAELDSQISDDPEAIAAK